MLIHHYLWNVLIRNGISPQTVHNSPEKPPIIGNSLADGDCDATLKGCSPRDFVGGICPHVGVRRGGRARITSSGATWTQPSKRLPFLSLSVLGGEHYKIQNIMSAQKCNEGKERFPNETSRKSRHLGIVLICTSNIIYSYDINLLRSNSESHLWSHGV